jgi:pyruvate dehydrogenase E2 component (dihydrolipoamide acetyltransferase)
MSDFRMPVLGADMESGTVIDWLIKPGDTVQRGQIVAVVDTAKASIEIEVFEDGTVEEILVPVGTQVPVGTALARLSPAGASPALVAKPEPKPVAKPEPAAALEMVAAGPEPVPVRHRPPRPSPVVRNLAKRLEVNLKDVTGTGVDGRIVRSDVEGAAAAHAGPEAMPARKPASSRRPAASPLARRRAQDAGIDLADVHGTGPGGAISAADVAAAAAPQTPPARTAVSAPEAPPAPAVRAAEAPPARAAEAARARQAAMRRAIGELMARSKREIPHYYLATTIDMTSALAWLREHNAGLAVADRVVPSALLFKATALAAHSFAEMNGHFVDGEFRPSGTVRLGIPVALRGGGLLTPAIEGADTLSPGELMAQLRDLVNRAKAGRLRGTELAEPSLTVTNLGDQGVETVYGVIYPPQVALVGFGSVVERPWAVDGLLGVRSVVTATLSADHRVSDGHRGALFLAAIDEHLHHPEEL